MLSYDCGDLPLPALPRSSETFLPEGRPLPECVWGHSPLNSVLLLSSVLFHGLIALWRITAHCRTSLHSPLVLGFFLFTCCLIIISKAKQWAQKKKNWRLKAENHTSEAGMFVKTKEQHSLFIKDASSQLSALLHSVSIWRSLHFWKTWASDPRDKTLPNSIQIELNYDFLNRSE